MAMDHPKISIITTVYKTGHYLPLTVQSILAQTALAGRAAAWRRFLP